MARRSQSSGAVAPAPVKQPEADLPVAVVPEAERKKAVAKAAMHSAYNGASVVHSYGRNDFGQLEMEALVRSMNDSIKDVQAGDLSKAEAMLYGQATALQSIFTHFSRRALIQEYQNHLESFLRMALKAQNQCRMTLETLATLKNPQVVFAKQANINNGGQQQVNNNGAAPGAPNAATAPASRDAKPVVQQNELLEASHGQWLDTGATSQAGRADQVMETVGQVHRPEDGRGQGQLRTQRLQGRRVSDAARHAARDEQAPEGSPRGDAKSGPAVRAAAPAPRKTRRP